VSVCPHVSETAQ